MGNGGKLPIKHVTLVCKIGQGDKTCRYLGLGVAWKCLKHTSLRAMLDERAQNNKMTAQGDNCDGYSSSGKEAQNEL